HQLVVRVAAIPAPLRGTQAPPAPAAATQTPAPPANVTAIAPSAPAVDSEPAATPDPLASLDSADRPIAERIRDLFAARSDRIFVTGKERMAAQAFYQKRNLAPLWLDKGHATARAQSVMARLQRADADGLEARDYRIPAFSGGPDALAEAGLRPTPTELM